jgi:hypothetical protein
MRKNISQDKKKNSSIQIKGTPLLLQYHSHLNLLSSRLKDDVLLNDVDNSTTHCHLQQKTVQFLSVSHLFLLGLTRKFETSTLFSFSSTVFNWMYTSNRKSTTSIRIQKLSTSSTNNSRKHKLPSPRCQ